MSNVDSLITEVGPTLLAMADIKMLNILKMTCDMIGEPHESSMFGSQRIKTSKNYSCRTNEAPQNETDKAGMCDDKINMPDYFRSTANKAADKRANEVLTNNIHNEFSDVFPGIDCFEGTFSLQVKGGSICFAGTPKRTARETTEEANNGPLGMDDTSKWYNSFVLVPRQMAK